MEGHCRPLLKVALHENVFSIRQCFPVPEKKVKGANHMEVQDIYNV